MARAKADGEKKPSQKLMVKMALQDAGGDAKPIELQGIIKDKFNVELAPNIISNYKSVLKREANGDEADRPRRGRRPASGGIQIEDFEAVRHLVRRLGADQVKRLVDVVA